MKALQGFKELFTGKGLKQVASAAAGGAVAGQLYDLGVEYGAEYIDTWWKRLLLSGGIALVAGGLSNYSPMLSAGAIGAMGREAGKELVAYFDIGGDTDTTTTTDTKGFIGRVAGPRALPESQRLPNIAGPRMTSTLAGINGVGSRSDRRRAAG